MINCANTFCSQNFSYGMPSAVFTGSNIQLDDLLASLNNKTGADFSNITDFLLKSSLWPALQPHNWREQVSENLWQPEYIVMLILCVFALITNIVSIIAVSHIRHSLTTHLKLIINLAISDIFIVLSVLISMINKVFNSTMSPLSIGLTEPYSRLFNSCFLASINSLTIMSVLILLLNLLAMAMDHYIAIIKSLQYPYIMSKRRGYALIASMWFLAALGGFSNFLIGAAGYKSKTVFNFCEYIMYDSYHAEFLVFGVTIICLFAITFIYTRIFFEVRRIQAKMPSVPNFILHNKKALITTLVIIGTFILCWLPNCIFQLTMIVEIHLNKKAVYKLFSTFILVSKYLYILQLANCVLDPIIYAVRLKIVQKGYRNFLKRLRTKFGQTKSLFLRKKVSRPQRHNSSRRPTETVPIETTSDIKSEHLPCINLDYQTLDPERQRYGKLSDESDVNDNELIQMVTFCEHSSTDIHIEPNGMHQEHIPMIIIHQTQNDELKNRDSTVLLDKCQDENKLYSL